MYVFNLRVFDTRSHQSCESNSQGAASFIHPAFTRPQMTTNIARRSSSFFLLMVLKCRHCFFVHLVSLYRVLYLSVAPCIFALCAVFCHSSMQSYLAAQPTCMLKSVMACCPYIILLSSLFSTRSLLTSLSSHILAASSKIDKHIMGGNWAMIEEHNLWCQQQEQEDTPTKRQWPQKSRTNHQLLKFQPLVLGSRIIIQQ
jgi:hypothetical protein